MSAASTADCPALPDALGGVNVVPVVPMQADLTLDTPAFIRLMDDLVGQGIRSLFVGGHTGEFHSLTTLESDQLVAAAIDVTDGRAHVFAAAAHDLDAAKHSAAMAARLGCAGVLVHQPSNPGVSADGYVDYVRAIAASADVAVVPYLTSRYLAESVLPKLLEIDNIVAVKWGVADIHLFASRVEAAREDGRTLTWICGLAERWAPFFSALAPVGFTSGLANVHPQLSQSFAAAIDRGDRPGMTSLWPAIDRFEQLRGRSGGRHMISIVKTAMALQGRCDPWLRPPHSLPDPADVESLRALLAEWGILEPAFNNASAR